MAQYDFAAARAHVQKMIGYEFTTASLLEEALYAGGPTTIGGRSIKEGNKRLAMIGDHLLSLVICITDYRADLTRGMSLTSTDCSLANSITEEMSNRRSSRTSNENLSNVCSAKGLDSCIRLNDWGSTMSKDLRATAMEAILGAVYLDGKDVEIVLRCVRTLRI